MVLLQGASIPLRKPLQAAARLPGTQKRRPLAVAFLIDVSGLRLVVVFQTKVRDHLLALHVSQRVLQLHELNEQVMFRVEFRCAHGALEIEREPFLDAAHAASMGEIHEQRQVQHDRGTGNRP
jgi:hypothetical protein